MGCQARPGEVDESERWGSVCDSQVQTWVPNQAAFLENTVSSHSKNAKFRS